MPTNKEILTTPEELYKSVRKYYGQVLNTSSDLKTSACTTCKVPSKLILDVLAKIPSEIKDKYYGCGTPIPFGISGLNVLDLGSGSGRDCYVAAALVGPSGSVTGIDMTTEQLSVARKYVDEYTKTLGYPSSNMRFIEGYIEFLNNAGINRESLDIVISNCVINLSPNKHQVLSEVYNSLKPGGELFFSDVYCSRRLPVDVMSHDVLVGECIGGALYIEDFRRICQKIGFMDPRQLSISPLEVHDSELRDLVGEAKFFSITYRCFKLRNLEDVCEDYGQVAVYLGTIPEHKHSYTLDDHHVFETNLPMRVCGNTASMVGESWLKQHFRVMGNRDVHYGLFDCNAGPTAATKRSHATTGGGCC